MEINQSVANFFETYYMNQKHTLFAILYAMGKKSLAYGVHDMTRRQIDYLWLEYIVRAGWTQQELAKLDILP